MEELPETVLFRQFFPYLRELVVKHERACESGDYHRFVEDVAVFSSTFLEGVSNTRKDNNVPRKSKSNRSTVGVAHKSNIDRKSDKSTVNKADYRAKQVLAYVSSQLERVDNEDVKNIVNTKVARRLVDWGNAYLGEPGGVVSASSPFCLYRCFFHSPVVTFGRGDLKHKTCTLQLSTHGTANRVKSSQRNRN